MTIVSSCPDGILRASSLIVGDLKSLDSIGTNLYIVRLSIRIEAKRHMLFVGPYL
jgi:hypothetical protein